MVMGFSCFFFLWFPKQIWSSLFLMAKQKNEEKKKRVECGSKSEKAVFLFMVGVFFC